MYELIKIKIGPESKEKVTQQVVETEAKQEIRTARRRQRRDPEKFMPYAILLIDAGQIYRDKDFKIPPLNELKVSPQFRERVETAFKYMAGQGGKARTDALMQIAYMLVEEGLKAL